MTTVSKPPILLLDIDGVVAPFGGDHADQWGLATSRAEREDLPFEVYAGGYGDSIFIRKDLKWIFRRLEQHFDVVWGTGWGGYNANLVMSPILEFPPLAAVDFTRYIPGKVKMKVNGMVWLDKTRKAPDYWKMPWIEHWAEEHGRPFLFIDDEMRDDSIEWAEERNKTIPTLFVRTDCTIGWTDDHEAQLIEWAEGVSNE